MSGNWEHGLFGCFGNIGVCIITFFCPCYIQGKIGGAVGSSCLLCGCIQLIPIAGELCAINLRKKVRAARNIDGSCLYDCLAVWCCYFCVLCQSAREVGVLAGQAVEIV